MKEVGNADWHHSIIIDLMEETLMAPRSCICGLPRSPHVFDFGAQLTHPATQMAEFMPDMSWQFQARKSLVTLYEDSNQDGESILLYDSTCSRDEHLCG